MQKYIFKALILSAISLLSGCSTAKTAKESVPNQNLIICYEPKTGNKDLLHAAKKYGSEVLYVYKNINGIAVSVPKNKNLPDAIKYYENVKGVLSVTKDEQLRLQ